MSLHDPIPSVIMRLPLSRAFQHLPGLPYMLEFERWVLTGLFRWARVPSSPVATDFTCKKDLQQLETAAKELEVLLDARSSEFQNLTSVETINRVKEKLASTKAILAGEKKRRQKAESELQRLELFRQLQHQMDIKFSVAPGLGKQL